MKGFNELKRFGIIVLTFAIVQFWIIEQLSAQCTSGYTSGNLTISSTCSFTSNKTITGNLILNSGANITINPGVVVTVTGNVTTGWNVGTVRISGGTLNIGTYLLNDDQTTFNITGTNLTTGSYFLNDFKSNMNITNSTVHVGTYLHNEDQTNMVINNSVFVVGGYLYNDFKANFQLLNGSDMTINGSPSIGGYAFHNEDQTDFIVDNSAIHINGNVLNDFKGNLEVNNGGSMSVNGNFYNEDQATIALTGGSLQVSGNFTNDFKADIDVNAGGQMLIGGNLTSDSQSRIDVAPGGGFCTAGTSSNSSTIHSTANDTDCSDGCCGVVVTLPVELISFSGVSESGKTNLIWKTATEINNDYFTIEQSTDGIIFFEVGNVNGHGDSEVERTYTWSELVFTGGVVYYRLKQTDFNGKSEYLGVISVQNQEENTIKMYPNPANSGQNVKVSGKFSDRSEYIIYDLYGNRIVQGTFLSSNLVPTCDLKTGVYILTFQSGDKVVSEKLIIR